ncbi:hypothetical protein LTT01_23935, partial [Escherichia coli]|nr:hypothetical protein [Escherichia coli]
HGGREHHHFRILSHLPEATGISCGYRQPLCGSHENVPPDVVKPAGVVMKTTHHLHRHNNRGET